MGLLDKIRRKKPKESLHEDISDKLKTHEEVKIEQPDYSVPITGKVCERCGGDIIRGNKKTYLGKPYHKWCFRKTKKEVFQGKYKI